MAFNKPVRQVINARQASRYPNTLRFPEDIRQHGLLLNFKEYSYLDTQATKGVNSITDSIMLPLPSNIEDRFSVNVDRLELGTLGSMFANAASDGVGPEDLQFLGDIGKSTVASLEAVGAFGADMLSGENNSLANLASELGDKTEGMMQMARYLRRSAIDRMSPRAGFALETAGGMAINPHVTLNFDGVALKDHSFAWSLSPQTQSETDSLARIINRLKYHMLPEYKGIAALGGNLEENFKNSEFNRAILTYPSIVDVYFVGIDPVYFYYFKPCMIASFNANYTPNGVSLYKGGRPSSISLSLQLKEAEIHTRDDYKNE